MKTLNKIIEIIKYPFVASWAILEFIWYLFTYDMEEQIMELINLQEDLTRTICHKQADQIDDEILKALNKHGFKVDMDNIKEFAIKHNCRNLTKDGLNTLVVDNTPICVWTGWEVEPFDFTKEYKVNAFFKFQVL